MFVDGDGFDDSANPLEELDEQGEDDEEGTNVAREEGDDANKDGINEQMM